jgi:hypothetical protein
VVAFLPWGLSSPGPAALAISVAVLAAVLSIGAVAALMLYVAYEYS